MELAVAASTRKSLGSGGAIWPRSMATDKQSTPQRAILELRCAGNARSAAHLWATFPRTNAQKVPRVAGPMRGWGPGSAPSSRLQAHGRPASGANLRRRSKEV